MRRPAVSAWASIAVLTFAVWSGPARSLDLDYQAYLGYEDTGGGTSWIALPIVTVPGPDGLLMGVINDWSWTCSAALGCANDGFVIEDFDLTLDPDPVITFGTTVTDVGAPSAFTVFYQQAIVPTAAPGTASASLQGGTSNGGGSAGPVSVTPTAQPGFISTDTDGISELMVYSLSTDGGGTWLNAGLDLGPAFNSNPSQVTDTYGPFNPASVAGPATSGFFYNYMRVDVNFSLSGGNDKFQYSGNATILEEGQVPEPATGALVALGLLGCGLTRRLRS